MDGCVLAAGKPGRKGYVSVRRGSKVTYAHRAAWEEANGPIPPGHHVHHTCGTKACVRLSHLMLVSAKEHGRIHAPERTSCPNGHDYTANVFIDRGRRRCRTCTKNRQARYMARLRGE